MKLPTVLINIVVFQVLWWLAVLGGRILEGIPVLVYAILFLCLHVRFVEGKASVQRLLVAAVSGVMFDQVGYQIGMVKFSDYYSTWLPLWMIALWLGFVCTLNVSFKWLHGRHIMAGILGAIFGPVSYWAAFKLGAVAFPDLTISMVWLAVGWGILFPALLEMQRIALAHVVYQEPN